MGAGRHQHPTTSRTRAFGNIVGARRTPVKLDVRSEPIPSVTPPAPRPVRPTRRRLLAAGAGAAALAACGAPGTAGETPGGGAAAEQPAKLLWGIRAGPTYEQLVKEGLALFNQKFPKV